MFIPFLKKERECTFLIDLENKKNRRVFSTLKSMQALPALRNSDLFTFENC